MPQISKIQVLSTPLVGDETVVISSPANGDNTFITTVSDLRRAKNVTEAQRLAMTPEISDVVYQTDATEGLWVYKSTGWASL